MADKIKADASPEKRLFISLLTRDIPLAAAFLDLIDNSINAAVEPYAARLRTANDYLTVLQDDSIVPTVNIRLDFDEKSVTIADNAGGISSKTAAEHVFKFGRGPDEEADKTDRLSVYGIGLKRAIFKLGDVIKMKSEHIDGGFGLNLNVPVWAKSAEQPWRFDIEKRPKVVPANTGTTIAVSKLHDEVSIRLRDGVFEGQLREAISRTYAYFLAKFVTISVNGKPVEGVAIEIGQNHSSETFDLGSVSCAVTAGIGIPQAGGFRDRSSGWFIFCNGRAVISADKSALTGWGNSLPLFQPKHRPFLGTVYFVSEDPEQLPWTTTKSAINEDSSIWQLAKRHMATVGRVVISFLDSRYTDDGTEVNSKDLQEASGAKTSVLAAAVSGRKVFAAPKKPIQTTTKIQYDAKIDHVKAIAEYLGRPSMSGSDIGRYTFTYFINNEVGVS
jgi:hypothetical protein